MIAGIYGMPWPERPGPPPTGRPHRDRRKQARAKKTARTARRR